MGIHQLLRQVKAGDGMEAIEARAGTLYNGARIVG